MRCVSAHSEQHTCVLLPGTMGAMSLMTVMPKPFAVLLLLWEQIAIPPEVSVTSMSPLPSTQWSLCPLSLEALL